MEYESGSVIRVKNIKFKGTEKLDLHIHGRPVLIPHEVAFADDYHYYLTLSTQVHNYTKDKERYYLLKAMRNCGLPEPCIVDLKYSYRHKKNNCICREPIPNHLLDKVIERAKFYKEKESDEDYLELLKILS